MEYEIRRRRETDNPNFGELPMIEDLEELKQNRNVVVESLFNFFQEESGTFRSWVDLTTTTETTEQPLTFSTFKKVTTKLDKLLKEYAKEKHNFIKNIEHVRFINGIPSSDSFVFGRLDTHSSLGIIIEMPNDINGNPFINILEFPGSYQSWVENWDLNHSGNQILNRLREHQTLNRRSRYVNRTLGQMRAQPTTVVSPQTVLSQTSSPVSSLSSDTSQFVPQTIVDSDLDISDFEELSNYGYENMNGPRSWVTHGGRIRKKTKRKKTKRKKNKTKNKKDD